jgi:outer membrane receptor protein involved in Fe transport
VLNNTLMMNNDFSTPSLSTALFHQSTFNDIFVEGLSFTAGLRLEYEKLWMRYDASSSIDFDFNVEVSPTMKFPMKNLNAAPRIAGKTGTDYWQLLPKFALKYDLSKSSNIYASVTKGYRSGGYNIQMFSDLIQKEMQTAMTGAIVNGVPNIQGLPANMVPVVQNMINTNVPAAKEIDVKGTTLYKPEYSWNFEVGSHFDLFNGKVKADVAAFLMNTHDQQIVKFVESGLGRIMVNAGKSRSIGAEAAFIAAITKSLNFNVNYGYTYSTFRKYDGGVNRVGVEIDYTGNYVPFVPKHTLAIGGDYTFFLNDNALKNITIGANYTGAGKIYWSESNDQSQDFVGSLNGYLSLGFKNLQVDFWGRNLTDKKYTTFYFESMNRGFEQYNKPIQFGVDLKYHF